MEGMRLMTKAQVQEFFEVGKRIVDEMFADPEFPKRGGKNQTQFVWEPDLLAYVKKKWRK